MLSKAFIIPSVKMRDTFLDTQMYCIVYIVMKDDLSTWHRLRDTKLFQVLSCYSSRNVTDSSHNIADSLRNEINSVGTEFMEHNRQFSQSNSVDTKDLLNWELSHSHQECSDCTEKCPIDTENCSALIQTDPIEN